MTQPINDVIDNDTGEIITGHTVPSRRKSLSEIMREERIREHGSGDEELDVYLIMIVGDNA
jgi:hypothetical protein